MLSKHKKFLKENGLCCDCGLPRGEDGTRYFCRPCADKNAKTAMRRAARLKEKGCCQRCGVPKDDSFNFCTECRAKVSRTQQKHQAERCKADIQFRLRSLLRARLRKAVKHNTKTGSAVRDLGCTIAEFKEHIERQFLPGMTWDNWGRGVNRWNIDHIIPLASVDLADREQFLRVCHYTNLRPLWFVDNIRAWVDFSKFRKPGMIFPGP